ncbi:MAG: glycosyltransferase family 2 protein [Lachnospiraceae bacterium]|nr:glycosyltransferase family 2 protein [Lachnospiraceae bacterium]
MKTELTVIVPLYNQKSYIEECIESILSQSYEEISVIIVDDGSTDGSSDICEELAGKDSRIEVIHQENKGLAGARFAGLLATKTKYVTFVDADDFILPDSYIYALKAMENDIDMIFFEITRYFNESYMKKEHHTIEEGYYDRERIETVVFPKLIWNFERNTPGIDCSQCVRIVKTELLLGEYNNWKGKNLYYGEDAAITYPLYMRISSMQVISKSYYMHRQRVNSLPSYICDDNYFDQVTILYNRLLDRCSQYIGNYDLKKQIQYFYMYSIELKKKYYGDYAYHRDFLFPFDRVSSGMRLVIYGAGEVGQAYYKQVQKLGYCKELLWIDKNASNISDERVLDISELKKNVVDVVVIAIENHKICHEVETWLISQGIGLEKIIY